METAVCLKEWCKGPPFALSHLDVFLLAIRKIGPVSALLWARGSRFSGHSLFLYNEQLGVFANILDCCVQTLCN